MEKNYTYEITENGYRILKNGVIYMVQEGIYIPNPNLSYEENAQAQIAEMIASDENAVKEQATMEQLEERVSAVEDMINMNLGF